MKTPATNICRAVAVSLFLGAGAFANAHPGPPGHYHPDEVDEFDRVAVAAEGGHDVNLGGILTLAGIGACLGFAFFQKRSGIWKDVTADH